jgi:hypothetical protein
MRPGWACRGALRPGIERPPVASGAGAAHQASSIVVGVHGATDALGSCRVRPRHSQEFQRLAKHDDAAILNLLGSVYLRTERRQVTDVRRSWRSQYPGRGES